MLLLQIKLVPTVVFCKKLCVYLMQLIVYLFLIFVTVSDEMTFSTYVAEWLSLVQIFLPTMKQYITTV
jgi:hypothetical protein